MLNTELFNPNVQAHRKMTMEGYLKNLKGTNGGGDFPPEMLAENYNSIKDNEIKIPEEQVNERQISNSTWRYLLTSSDQQDSFSVTNADSGIYDKFLFSLTWRQIHAAARSVFAAAVDAELSEQMLRALLLSGEICSHFGLHHAFDNIVTTLGELSTLVSPPGPTPYAEKLRWVQFSRNKRAQLATLALFDLARSCPTQMRDGWNIILTVLFNVSPLIKLPLIEREDIFKLPKSLLIDEPPREKQEATSSPILGIVTSFWPFGGGSSSSTPLSADEGFSSDEEGSDLESTGVSADSETPRDKLRRLIVHDCQLADLFKRTRDIDIGSLDHLLNSLLSSAATKWSLREGSRPSNRDITSAVFALDMLVDIILANAHRLQHIWPRVHELVEKILLGLHVPNTLTNKAILSVLYVAARLLPLVSEQGLAEMLCTSLGLLTKMSEENIVFYSERIGIAIGKLVIRCAEACRVESVWQTLFSLCRWTLQFPKFSKEAFDGVVYIVSPFRYHQKIIVKQAPETANAAVAASHPKSSTFVSPQNFTWTVATIIAFGRLQSCPVEIALECLELLQFLISTVPSLLGLPVPTSSGSLSPVASMPSEILAVDAAAERRALDSYISPVLTALSERTRDPRILVRHHAMSHLQKALLAPEMALCTSASWIAIFESIIFPLLVQLLEPVSQDTTRDVVEETRLRASALLCKTFLHYMSRIDVSSFHMLWLKVLSFVEMYMKADNSELLSEAVTESLKNILLVMFASGLLAKPDASADGTPNSDGSTLWDLSWKTIDSFSPQLRREFMLKVYPPDTPTSNDPTSSTEPELNVESK